MQADVHPVTWYLWPVSAPTPPMQTLNHHLAFWWLGAISLSGYFLALSPCYVAFAQGSDSTSTWWTLPHGTCQILAPESKIIAEHITLLPAQPALTIKGRHPGQTVPYCRLEKGLCPWCCVCTGLIMIWKNVWFPFYTLWIINRLADPGWCINTTEAYLMETGTFRHSRGCGPLESCAVALFGVKKAISLLRQIVSLICRKKMYP